MIVSAVSEHDKTWERCHRVERYKPSIASRLLSCYCARRRRSQPPPYGIIMAPVLVFPLLQFTIVVGHLAVSSTTNPQIRSLCTWRALCLFRKPFGFPANVEKKHSKPTLCRSPRGWVQYYLDKRSTLLQRTSSLVIWTAQANGQSTLIRCPQSAVRIFSVASWNLHTHVQTTGRKDRRPASQSQDTKEKARHGNRSSRVKSLCCGTAASAASVRRLPS